MHKTLVLHRTPEDPQAFREHYESTHIPLLSRVPGLRAFRHSFDVVRKLPCDVLLTAHPDQSGGDVKYAQIQRRPLPNPYIDLGACRAYADKHAALLTARLAREKK